VRDEVEKMADRVAGDTHDVREKLDNIYLSVSEAAEKSSRRIINNIETTLEPLSDAVKKALPSQIADLEKASKAYNKAIKTSRQATAEIQKNIKYMQWRHYRAFMLAVFFVILGLWGLIHFKYEQRFKEQCAVLAGQMEDNNDILYELAKAKRRLELTTDENGSRLLSMRNAKAWISTDKRGVIEFR
jgi:exonuclease VII small subunit